MATAVLVGSYCGFSWPEHHVYFAVMSLIGVYLSNGMAWSESRVFEYTLDRTHFLSMQRQNVKQPTIPWNNSLSPCTCTTYSAKINVTSKLANMQHKQHQCHSSNSFWLIRLIGACAYSYKNYFMHGSRLLDSVSVWLCLKSVLRDSASTMPHRYYSKSKQLIDGSKGAKKSYAIIIYFL